MIKAGMHPMQNTEALMHIDSSTHMQLKAQSASSSNNRILDIPCKVCGDFSSGKHYNIFACDGCAGFFKRSIRRNRQYMCKAKDEGLCIIDKAHRNQCRACRLKKCQNVGMNKDGKNLAAAVDSKHSTSRKDFSNKAVQHERGPRNSTIRRQQMSFFGGEGRVMVQPPENVLNLTMPKYESSQPVMEHPVPLVPSANFLLNNLLPIPRVPMHFPPMFPPALINHQAICESAASLLFMNVQWIRNLPTFTSLPHCDQILLLGESWLDLFILGTAQFLPYINISLLAQAAGVFQGSPSPKSETLLREVQAFQDILKKIAEFQLDPHEYSCLRAIVLFRTSFEPPRSSKSHKQKSLIEQSTVSDIQDDAQMRLNRHISATYPKQPLRFGKILLLVSSAFRGLSEDTIEELFFKKAIQDTPLVAILAVQHERGPRNSTIRRQQMSFFGGEGRVMVQPPENVLNLTMPKYESSQPVMEHPVPLVPSANFLLNNLLPIPRVPMHFPPMFPPALINHQAICESAASLLFMNVQWIRNLPTFTSLPHCDQILLLGESWLDLFILGTAQFLPYINISLLAQAAGVFQGSPSPKSETLLREVQAFQDILKKIAEFQLDPHEYSCLRAIVLFRTSFEPPRSSKSHKQKSLIEQSTVSDIQDDAQMRLNRHISATYPKQPLRFGKILLLVSSAFRGLSEDTIEELFFKKAIQDTPLVAILGNMYNNKFPTDGNPQ